MSSLKEVIFIYRHNSVQRIGLFVSLALAALVLMLHYPFEGYYFESFVTTYYGQGPCPGLEDLKKATSETLAQVNEAAVKCNDAGEMQTIPFSDWRSNAPIIEWFGSVAHAISAIVFVLLLGLMWLWLFRTSDDA